LFSKLFVVEKSVLIRFDGTFLERRATFFRTLSINVVIVTLPNDSPTSYGVSKINDPPILQRIFTLGTIPSLIVPSFDPIIGIQPIPSFHAYHESVRESGYIRVFEKSIHPAKSDHAYHEIVHGSRGLPLAAGTNCALFIPTHQMVSIQR
jgi:hypothetical protein